MIKNIWISLNSDDDLPLKKTLKLCNMIIVVRFVFHEGNKYYPQVVLDAWLYKLSMFEYDRIDVSERIDVCHVITGTGTFLR